MRRQPSATAAEGELEADPELRDTERVPLTETVDEFFEREVLTSRTRRLDRRVQA